MPINMLRVPKTGPCGSVTIASTADAYLLSPFGNGGDASGMAAPSRTFSLLVAILKQKDTRAIWCMDGYPSLGDFFDACFVDPNAVLLVVAVQVAAPIRDCL